MTTFWEAIATLIAGAVTIAIVATVMSRNSQAPAVIQSAASGVGNIFGVAEAPVTGASYSPVLSYPGTDFTGAFGHMP